MHDLLVSAGKCAGQTWQDDRSNVFGVCPLARDCDELGESQEDVIPFTIAEKSNSLSRFSIGMGGGSIGA